MNRYQKNTVIAVILACLLTMAIGYSLLNQVLNINGTSRITTDFNIQVVGINEKLLLGLAETSNKSISTNSASYSVNIQAPGDSAFYEIVVENKGTVTGTAKIADNLTTQITSSNNVAVGVFGVSKESKTFSTYSEFGALVESLYMNNPSGEVTLVPGEKAYYYAAVIFDSNATSLPSQKTYSNELKFTFNSVENSGSVTGTTYNLSDALLEDTAVVTSGPGLYLTNNTYSLDYSYRSSAGEDFNNYVEIDGKLWRVGTMTLPGTSSYYTYELIEVDENYDVYSTTADSNGYYNNSAYSTLKDDIFYEYDYKYTVFTFETGSLGQQVYVYDTGFKGIITGSPDYRALLDVREVMSYSTSSDCEYANLSSGGCQSWLTDNGDTFLWNAVHTSSSNTGNIAYLEDGKVIAVNPQESRMYKVKVYMTNYCGTDFEITNYGIGDGSKDNPYIVDVSTEKQAEWEACW